MEENKEERRNDIYLAKRQVSKRNIQKNSKTKLIDSYLIKEKTKHENKNKSKYI